MVLKGTKRSLRTGNTLRNIQDTRTNRKTSSVIVRHVTGAKSRQATDEADDSFLTADGVEFSLNKKGRWNLPGVIEGNIEHFHTGQTTALLRRHRVNRQNDCVSVTASAAFDDDVFQRKKARRKTYCNGLNVLHNGRGKSTKETRKKRVVSTKKDLELRQKQDPSPTQEKVKEDHEPIPEVRYDVFYPVPSSSSLRFHPKFAATPYSDDLEPSLTVTTGCKSSKASFQRCKHIDYDHSVYYDEEDYYDDWFYDEDFYDESVILMDTEYERDSFFLYSDYMEQAFEEASLRSTTTADTAPSRKKSRQTKPRKRRGHFFYTPEAEDEADSCLEDSQSESSVESDSAPQLSPQPSVIKLTEIPSVIIELSKDSTCSQKLTELYGLKYSEAACSPRKIILEITDHVQMAAGSLASLRDVFVPSVDLTTYLVLTYICSSDPKREDQDTASVGQYEMFRVQLNMNCMAQGLTLSLNGKTTFNSVQDLLEQVLTFMNTLTPENLTRHPCEPSASIMKAKRSPDFRTVAEANRWKASCVSLQDEQSSPATVPALFPPMQSRNASSPEIPAERPQTPCEIYCHICFIEIVPGSLQGPHGMALSQCQHWFCDTCWQSHLSVIMRESGGGGGRMLCPEFRCQVEVDLPTLLSLQHVRDVIIQQRRLVEVKVMRMFLCKWCPNPHCGRVVKLAASRSMVPAEPTSMSCPCGQRFCFRCHGDAHWPMSCEDLTQYLALLRKNTHIPQHGRLSQIVVRGKPCPRCRRFIEKDGGCPHMSCVCGHQFWWCCRKPVSASHDCHKFIPVNDTTNTTKMVLKEKKKEEDPSQQESEWYKMAVLHRSLQEPKHVRLVCRRVDQLRKRLQCQANKGVDVGVGAVSESTTSLKLESAEQEVCQLHHKEKARRQEVFKMEGVVPADREVTRQRIQRVTNEMLQLKVELHNVVENSAAFLHLRHTSDNRVLKKIMDTVGVLQFVLSSLDGLLEMESRRGVSQVVPSFRHLQRYARDTLTILTGLVNKM